MQVCGNCFFFLAGDNVCRRFPPQVSALAMSKDVVSGETMVQMNTAFPSMKPDLGWCGEWKERIA